jgi:hypothetical protein
VTCDVCDQPADVAIVQPGDDTSPGPSALCAYHLALFAVQLLAGRRD